VASLPSTGSPADRSGSAAQLELVEAAGIEPASEEVRTRASTRLADSFSYLARGPLSGK